MSDLKGPGFGLIVAKKEGESLSYDYEKSYTRDPNWIETVYVERRVPIKLEKKANEVIDQLLKMHGYTKDML